MIDLSKLWAVIPIFALLIITACASDENEKSEQFDLYLLIGQSNMAGRGALNEGAAQFHDRVLMLNKDGQWTPARDPMHFDKPGHTGVGPGLSFGRIMAAKHKKRIIALIPAAAGGSEIASWVPGGYHDQTNSYPYDDAIDRSLLAMKSGTLKGILWHQGESDAHDAKLLLYKDALIQLAENLRRDLGVNDVPFVVAGLGEYLADKQPGTLVITSILKDAPSYISNTGYVSATGLTHGGDGIHFDSNSARELGRRYADKIIQMQQDTIGSQVAPQTN